MSNTVDEILDLLGTPEFAVLEIGERVWKFRQPQTYSAQRSEARAEAEWIKAHRNGENLMPEHRELLPKDFDDAAARMVYILHKRCIESPNMVEGEPAISLPDAIKLLRAPKFCELVEKVLGAYSYNESARLLEAEVAKEKNALSETPST